MKTEPSDAWLLRAATQTVPLKLGQGYDVREDHAIDFNIFSQELTGDAISRVDVHKSEVRLVDDSSINDKFRALNIDEQLQLSVMLGLTKMDEFECFLAEERSNSNQIAIHLVHVFQTEIDQVDVYNDSMRGIMDGSRLSSATHVVTGIIYGGRTVYSFVVTESDAEEIVEKLKSMFMDIQKWGERPDPSSLEMLMTKNIELKFENDSFVNSAWPVAVDVVLDIFQYLSMNLNDVNKWRGVPIKYRLTPLSAFAVGFERTKNTFVEFPDLKLHDIVLAMEMAKEGSVKLDELRNWMQSKSYYFTTSEMDQVAKQCRKISRSKTSFMRKMRELIRNYRNSPNEDLCEEMDEAIDQFTKDCSPAAVDKYIEKSWKDRVEYVNFLCQEAAKEDVSVVSRGFERQVEIGGRYILLLINFELWKAFSAHTATAIRLFHVLIEEKHFQQHPTRFILVDLLEETALQHATLRDYCGGDEHAMAGLLKSRVWMNPSAIQSDVSLKGDLPFSLVCPGHYLGRSCSRRFHQWQCMTCLAPLQYWYEGVVGCKNCGVCPVEACRFKCNDPNHGPEFAPFDASKQRLSRCQADDEVNLLFIGETGSGKSTTICSIANFFSFETLECATEHIDSLLIPLPVKFTVTGGAFWNGPSIKPGEGVQVEFGDNSDHNECHEEGESATQHCKSYVLFDQRSGRRIRLIDVPGIGDTRGLNQDKENVDEIMDFIAKFDHIHAICVVMKSNQTRLTDTFSYCLMEILSRVHESAAKNVLFLFTYARASMYSVGDTYGPLKKLLDGLSKPSTTSPLIQFKRTLDMELTEDRMYFFDNEGFRTACAIKKGLAYDADVMKSMAQSWTKSRESTMRLRDFVTTLEPHATADTVLLNRVRRDVLLLGEPMRVLLENIHSNIKRAKDTQAVLENLKSNKEVLEANLFVESTKLVPFVLKKPMTVCTKPSCVSVEKTDNNESEARTVYRSKCHEGCGAQSIPINKTHSRGLKYCRAMNYSQILKFWNTWTWLPVDYLPVNGTCQCCLIKNGETCYWYDHMHVIIDFKSVPIRIELAGTKKQIESVQVSEDIDQIALRALRDLLQEQREEQDILTKASAQFASFIVHNSVAPVNYHALEMLKLQSQNAASKYGASSDRVQLLNDTKRKMEAEITTLENAYQQSLKNGTPCIELEPSAVQSTIDKLSNLKISGEALKSAFETTTSTKVSPDVVIDANCHHDQMSLFKRGQKGVGKMVKSGLKMFNFWHEE